MNAYQAEAQRASKREHMRRKRAAAYADRPAKTVKKIREGRQRISEREQARIDKTIAGTRPWPLDELVEEFLFLKGSDHPHSLALRLGVKPASLKKRFAENGYEDLAQLFRC